MEVQQPSAHRGVQHVRHGRGLFGRFVVTAKERKCFNYCKELDNHNEFWVCYPNCLAVDDARPRKKQKTGTV